MLVQVAAAAVGQSASIWGQTRGVSIAGALADPARLFQTRESAHVPGPPQVDSGLWEGLNSDQSHAAAGVLRMVEVVTGGAGVDELARRANVRYPTAQVPGASDASMKPQHGTRSSGIPVALIHGMPGTGKSATICRIIEAVCRRGGRVLVTALTNCAVDNVLERMLRSKGRTSMPATADPAACGAWPAGGSVRCIRVRRPASPPAVLVQSPWCRFVGPGAGDDEPETVDGLRQMIRSASVVGLTATACMYPSTHAYVKCAGPYDLCIVDEAAQMSQPAAAAAIGLSRAVCLVGDDEQLPPMVRSDAAARLGLRTSVFALVKDARDDAESLHLAASASSSSSTGGSRRVYSLCKQYRMCTAIEWLSNQVTYNGHLSAGSEAISRQSIGSM